MTKLEKTSGYLHGYSTEEQDRLFRQARFVEHWVHDRLPFRHCRKLIEIGSGVGAQTEVLLRHFPDLEVTGIELSPENLARAEKSLAQETWAKGRYRFEQGAAEHLTAAAGTFDSAFLCWVLEHVADPRRVLAEARRVLRPGSPIVVTEVLNSSFFLDPYSPNTMAYWLAFNDYQLELGGDPFVGAKLGNYLQAVGYRDIVTKVKVIHLDNRAPGERAEFLSFWSDLLLSGADGLQAAGKVSTETVEGMRSELESVAHSPDSVFFFAFVQAQARVF